MTDWDMHGDPAAAVPTTAQLPAGMRVTGVVVCHHPFGLGVRVDAWNQYGHADVPSIRDGVVSGPADYPPIGRTVSALVLGYSGSSQLRLTLKLSDLALNAARWRE